MLYYFENDVVYKLKISHIHELELMELGKTYLIVFCCILKWPYKTSINLIIHYFLLISSFLP